MEIGVETDVETGVEIGIETGVESIYIYIYRFFFFVWLLWPVSGFGCSVVSRFGGGMVASFLWLLWFLGGSYYGCSVWWVSIWIWGGGF